jgi:hypothetical protein
MMKSPAGGRKGRDDDRNQDRQGRGNNSKPQTPNFKGADSSLPIMFYTKTGNAIRWNRFLDGLKVYARKQFILGLDNICDPVDPKYPVINDPVLDDALVASVGAAAAEQVRVKEILKARDKRQTLEEDKVKFHAVIVGQLATTSKEQLKSTGEGLDALEGTDPLALINQLRITHMQDSKKPGLLTLISAFKTFANCTCRSDQSLDSYKADLEASVLQLANAIIKADQDLEPAVYVNMLPSDALMAAKFVDGLPPQFGAFKQKVEREEMTLMATINEAYDAANKHGPQYAPGAGADRHAMAGHVERGKKGGKQAGGGSGASSKEDTPVAGKDGTTIGKHKGRCSKCEKFGHHQWNCPNNDGKEETVVGKTVKFLAKQEN